jgi:FkbH-like protein
VKADTKVKCVIWDLDETLWNGTLADNDAVHPRPDIVDLVKALDAVGIVNSVCSKNDPRVAEARLREAGVWDYFVFPSIEFAPKGARVRAIVESMNLRLANVVFVDDNPSVRQEVMHACAGISVLDANDPSAIAYLVEQARSTRGTSRREQYRVLERKHAAALDFDDHVAFLNASGIVVSIVRNPGDLAFRERIIELANRSNQLNFTSSRFTDSSFADYVAGDGSQSIHHGAVFAYDNYGDYGLVGFYGFDETRGRKQLDHFVFSCRIMDMGIEAFVFDYLQSAYNVRPLDALRSQLNGRGVRIRLIHALDERLRRYVDRSAGQDAGFRTSIIAGCTAGVIAHYLPDDLQPCSFENFSLSSDSRVPDVPVIIYTVYQDYVNAQWRGQGGFSRRCFQNALERFFAKHARSRIFVVLAAEGRGRDVRAGGAFRLRSVARSAAAIWRGTTRRRIVSCNKIVRRTASLYPHVDLLEADEFIHSAAEQIDSRHFHRVVIERIAEAVQNSVACWEGQATQTGAGAAQPIEEDLSVSAS